MYPSNGTLTPPTNTTASVRLLSGIKTGAVVMYSLLCFLGITGNTMVIYIFGRKKERQRTTNEMLLLWLGICDLIYSLIQPPLLLFTFTNFGTQSSYIAGCFVTPLVAIIVVTTSQIVLIVICYDRYRAIVQPLQPRLCKAVLRAGICFGFVISILISIPTILQFDIETYGSDVCLDLVENKYNTLIQSSSVLLRDIISLILMGYFIHKMLASLRTRESFRSVTALANDGINFYRTRRILYAVLIVFTICILPGDVFYFAVLSKYFGKVLTVSEFDMIFVGVVFMKMLQVSNSSANVFIYSCIHPEFKKMNRRILGQITKCWRRNGGAEDTSSTLHHRPSRRRLLRSSTT